MIDTFDKLSIEADTIQQFLDTTMSDDPTEARYRGNDLSVYISRTGKMLADAKLILNKRKKSDIMNTLKEIAIQTPFATARTVNELMSSLCADEQYLVDWLERINKSATHQLDWCRTVISLAKEEMKLGNYQT